MGRWGDLFEMFNFIFRVCQHLLNNQDRSYPGAGERGRLRQINYHITPASVERFFRHLFQFGCVSHIDPVLYLDNCYGHSSLCL